MGWHCAVLSVCEMYVGEEERSLHRGNNAPAQSRCGVMAFLFRWIRLEYSVWGMGGTHSTGYSADSIGAITSGM